MKRKIQVTRDQLDKLIADIHALPDEPVGDHLSDDEFIGYTMEALVQEEVARLDAHLASCPDCTSEMERLMEASEVWRGEQGEQRLARLRKRALAALTPVQPERSLIEKFLKKISSLFIGWQIPVTLAAGILVGIALTPLWRAEQDGMRMPTPTEQIRGEMKGGQASGECELTADKTALPTAEEWLKLIAEDVVQGRVDEAVDQLEVFRCYYPDYKKSPSSASPQEPKTQ